MTQIADGNDFFIEVAETVDGICGTADCHEGPTVNFDLMYELQDAIFALAVKHGLREPRPEPEPISLDEIPF